MRDKLVARVAAFVERESIASDRPLVMGVSGGPDSLALLHILGELLDHSLVTVGHLDHDLRPEAAAEAQRLAQLAAYWQMPFYQDQVDVAALARARGWSVEEAGRQARYAFLAGLARRVGAEHVVVGHHAGDQAETILLHLLRGSGLGGLRGMTAVAPLPTAPDLTLLRPLLTTTREEIEAYCVAQHLRPFSDDSNLDTGYARNRVRHDLLPELLTYNPQINRQLRQLADVVAAEDDLLCSLTDDAWPVILRQVGPSWLVLDRAQFLGLPVALQRRLLRRAFATLRGTTTDLSYESIEQARAVATQPRAGARAALPAGLSLLADQETLILASALDEVASRLPQLLSADAVALVVPGQVSLGNGWILTAESSMVDYQDVVANSDPWQAYVALEAGEALQVRPRRRGERMQPLGMHGRSTSLQDLFVDRKVPGRLRARWPIVSTADHAVWVVGHVIDHRSRVTAEHDTVVSLHCRPGADAAVETSHA